MNVRLLRKVAKHISEEPRRFIMGSVIQQRGEGRTTSYDASAFYSKQQPLPKCGTAACIAGWTCVLSDGPVSIPRAARLLGIKGSFFKSGTATSRLFDLIDWPLRFRNAYEQAKTPRARVKVAVARIEHFIKTKGRE